MSDKKKRLPKVASRARQKSDDAGWNRIKKMISETDPDELGWEAYSRELVEEQEGVKKSNRWKLRT